MNKALTKMDKLLIMVNNNKDEQIINKSKQ